MLKVKGCVFNHINSCRDKNLFMKKIKKKKKSIRKGNEKPSNDKKHYGREKIKHKLAVATLKNILPT